MYGYTGRPSWVARGDEALRQEINRQRAQEARQESLEAHEAREGERMLHESQDRRERKLEALRAAAATSPCPACGGLEKSHAILTSTGLVARCRDCGMDWQEISR